MSTIANEKLISQISIAAQIVDGSIKIDSIDEFENILKLFPDDAELHRVYSDLLLTKDLPDAAAISYGQAAKLFIESGMMLQAIVSKSLQWKINPPSHLEEARYFFKLLHKGNYQETALNAFFSNLSHPAMLAILYSLVKVRLPAEKIVKKNGEGERDLFFIVSGALRETSFKPVKTADGVLYKKSTLNLSENDFFGDIYPFEDDKLSQSYIEAITQVELVRVSKSNLIKICRKYQDVEEGIKKLYEARSGDNPMKALRIDRTGSRHYLPVKINLKIFSDPSGDHPVDLEGYSRDISIGGICVLLDAKDVGNASFSKAIRNAKVQISLPSEAMALSVAGKIVWSKDVPLNEEKLLALGIKFEDMSPKLRGMVFAFAENICSTNSR